MTSHPLRVDAVRDLADAVDHDDHYRTSWAPCERCGGWMRDLNVPAEDIYLRCDDCHRTLRVVDAL